jgi:hypothetical protein
MSADFGEIRARAAAEAASIARHLLGPENRKLSKGRELRWGTRGSFTLNLMTGKWHDWESGEHGDMADLVCLEQHCDQRSAFQWLLRWLGEDATTARPQREQQAIRKSEEDAALTERRAEAEGLWREAMPLLGSPGEGYLIRRLGGAGIPHPII